MQYTRKNTEDLSPEMMRKIKINQGFLDANFIKENPDLYLGIDRTKSWILRDEFLYDFLSNKPRDYHILDIGCANGYFLSRLKEMGFDNLYGADLGNYLKDKSIDHQSVDLNIEQLQHEDSFFDVVSACETIEHLENYFLVMREIHRILKPEGYFIMAVPNHFNIFSRIKFLINGNINGWDYNNNHLLFTTRDVFKKTYLKYFDIVQVYYNQGPFPMYGRLNMIPGVKVPAKKRCMPRCEWFADKICYILRKKTVDDI